MSNHSTLQMAQLRQTMRRNLQPYSCSQIEEDKNSYLTATYSIRGA